MKTCPDCGERVYNLGCVNCNEMAYIEEQEMLTDYYYGKDDEPRSNTGNGHGGDLGTDHTAKQP
jgi:hypothetical protein